MLTYHPLILLKWKECKNGDLNFKQIYSSAESLYTAAAKKLESQRKRANQLYKKATSGLSNQVLNASGSSFLFILIF